MKHSQLFALFLVALTCRIAWADIGPGWYMQPLLIPTHPQKSSAVQYPVVLQQNYNGPITSTLLTGQPEVSEDATNENIISLARNLENDPKRIFDYVHNYIRYVHYFGSKKGAYLTLLEGSGNDFDQCALLVALLRAATTNNPTVNNYTVHYQFGMMRIPYESPDNLDLKHWLGLKFSGGPGNGDDDLDLIDNVYAGGGFPLYQQNFVDPNLNRFVLVPWVNGPDKTSFFVHRVWVKLHDNVHGTDSYLDPGFKTGNPIGGLDLSTAMGLNIADLFADAEHTWGGGVSQTTPEITPNYVRNLNYSAITNRLVAYTGNLLGQFQTSYKNISADDVISDYRIQESETCETCAFPGLPFTPQDAAFDVDNFGSIQPRTIPVLEWENIPSTYLSTLTLQIDDVTKTYKFPELKARKLTLTFPSKKATISLDDVVDPPTGTITTGTTASMITTVTNPFGTWDYLANSLKAVLDNRAVQNDGAYGTVTYQRDAPGYVIAYNFDDPSQLLTRRRQKLDALIRQGFGPKSTNVITETLNVLGLSWFQQTYLAERILAGQNDILATTWHRVGRVAQEKPPGLGYYIDIRMQILAPNSRSQPVRWAGPSRNAFFDMWAFAFSGMEHGVIEQLQPNSAASTIKTLYQANATGVRLILLTPNNVQDHSTAYQNYFMGYAADMGAGDILPWATADQLMSQVQLGVNLFLPGGTAPIGSWNGSGYVKQIMSPSGETTNMAMVINSAYSGGYSAFPTYIDPDPVDFTYLSLPTIFDPGSALLSHTFGADPVNMLDGSFTVDSVDLSVGQPEPRGFAFSRHYDTNRRFYNDANIGYGWTHNYSMKAAELSDPAAALGKTTPQAMAAFLVAMRAASAVFTANDSPPPWHGIGPPPPPPLLVTAPLRWGLAALITHWGVDQLKNNAVTITLGKDAVEFVKQPDGTYTPPAGSTMTLTKPAGYQLQMRHGNTFKFDAKHKQVTNIVDQYSKEMKFNYFSATDRRLHTVVDCWGTSARTLTLFYDTAKRLTSVSDGTRTVKFGYVQKNLTSVTDPESKTWTYQYDTTDNTNSIIATKDPLSRVITTNIYDNFGIVTQQLTQGDLAKAWNIYIAGNRVGVQKDPKGAKTTYYYDEKQRLAATKDANGNKSSSVYDGQDHVVQSITPKNESTYFEYDGRQNLTQITDPLNKIAIFKHDVDDTLTNYTDFHDIGTIGHGTTNEYNGKFLIKKITKPKINDTSDNIVNFTYNDTDVAHGPAGTLASRTDHEGQESKISSFQYDSHGELTNVTYQNNTDFETYFVNSLGDVTNYIDANGIVTLFEYNKRRQLTKTTVDPTGLNIITRITYDDAGNAQTATDGRGYTTINTYSATQKLLSRQFPQLPDHSVPMTVNHYDERDWLDFTENPLLDNGKTMYGYDAAGHLKTVTDPLIRTTTCFYDEDGHNTSVQSPLLEQNQTAHLGYNARGEQTSLTDAANHSIAYGYDQNGNPTTIQNRNNNTFVSTFYGNNQLHTFQTPLSRTTTYQYVQRGMVQSIKKPSDTTLASTTFEYDDRGRLSTKTDPINLPNTKTIYGYDKNNNLASVSENNKTIRRYYDHANRLYSYTDQNNNTIGYRYDNNGNLTNLIYPDSREVHYEYDSNNRLITVTDWASRVTKLTYDITGRPATITRPNGTVRQVTYDNANQLTAIDERTSDGAVIYRFVATTYDGAGRLTAEGVSPPSAFTTPTISAQYNGDNQISQYQGNTVNNNYDLDGNMISGPLNTDTFVTYGYDARNRLTSVGGVSYTYDSEGNRLTMTVSGQQPTTFTNDASGNVLIRTRPDGTKTYYVYGPGLLYDVGMNANGTEVTPNVRHTYHYDMRGSTVALTDTSGQITDRISYSPYGTLGTRTGNTDTPFLFNGRYGVMTDPNSLLYMQARYYNPYICRFINADPSGFSGGMNFYAYANGNPVSLLDPFGLGAVGESSVSSSSWFSTSSLDDVAYNASPAGQFMAGYQQTQAQMQQFTRFQPTTRSGSALSSALNAVPLVGGFKMTGEAFFGKDFVTGQRIEDLVAHAGAGVVDLTLSVLSLSALSMEAGAARSSMAAEEAAPKVFCFPAGTLVLMADGSVKAIEDVQEGDHVLAADPGDSEAATPRKVMQVHHNWTQRLIHVFIDKDGDGLTDGEFRATGGHPIWTQNRGWINAQDLISGDELKDVEGAEPLVCGTSIENTTCTTYNLTVDGSHTFYVLAGQTPVLVHNTLPGNRLYIIYQAPTSNGKIYTGMASMGGEFGTLTAQDVLRYRFGSGHHRGIDFGEAQIQEAIWGGGRGSDAYASARGAEELYDAQMRAAGRSANGNFPINPSNRNYGRYIEAAEEIGARPCP